MYDCVNPNNVSASELWSMSPENFNEWRFENDLPLLFSYFHEVLPGFQIWIDSIGVPETILYRIINMGAIFRGFEQKLILKQNDPSGEKYYCINLEDRSGPRWSDLAIPYAERKISEISSFVPYFKWVKAFAKSAKPILWDKKNSSYTDEFFFGGWLNLPPNSRASIWRGPYLLKLGGITLPQGTNIAERNLDFTDMDSLFIHGRVHGSSYKEISYSCFRFLRLEDTSQNFYRFHNCRFEDTLIQGGSLQDIYFYNCDVGKFVVKDAGVFRLSFSESKVLPFIEGCNLRGLIDFKPSKDDLLQEQTYRLLKNAYKSAGQVKYAAEYFYKEQVCHRSNLFSPHKDLSLSEAFPRGYPGSWKNVLKNKSKNKKALLFRKIKYDFNMNYILKRIEYKLQWVYSCVDWALWGHGVKLYRIFISAASIVALYAIIYSVLDDHLLSNGAPVESLWDFLYFSVVTFTTLGYGDVYPKSTLMRIICGSEAVFGVFIMGLIIAGFSSKGRD